MVMGSQWDMAVQPGKLQGHYPGQARCKGAGTGPNITLRVWGSGGCRGMPPLCSIGATLVGDHLKHNHVTATCLQGRLPSIYSGITLSFATLLLFSRFCLVCTYLACLSDYKPTPDMPIRP